MAALARASDTRVCGCSRLACQAVGSTQMTAGTLCCHRHTGVKSCGRPSSIARFVAGIAIGNSHTRQSNIWDMALSFAVSWRVSAAVASGALVRYRNLCVIPFCWFPCVRTMATHAVGRGGHVLAQLACCCTAVVASGAIRRRSVQTVVWLAACPCTGGFMASFTNCLAAVYGGRRAAGQSIICTQMAAGTLAGNRHTGVELGRSPTRIPTFVAGITIGNSYARE